MVNKQLQDAKDEYANLLREKIKRLEAKQKTIDHPIYGKINKETARKQKMIDPRTGKKLVED